MSYGDLVPARFISKPFSHERSEQNLSQKRNWDQFFLRESRSGLILAGGPTTFDELSQRATGSRANLIEQHAYANLMSQIEVGDLLKVAKKKGRKKVIESIKKSGKSLLQREEGKQPRSARNSVIRSSTSFLFDS